MVYWDLFLFYFCAHTSNIHQCYSLKKQTKKTKQNNNIGWGVLWDFQERGG